MGKVRSRKLARDERATAATRIAGMLNQPPATHSIPQLVAAVRDAAVHVRDGETLAPLMMRERLASDAQQLAVQVSAAGVTLSRVRGAAARFATRLVGIDALEIKQIADMLERLDAQLVGSGK